VNLGVVRARAGRWLAVVLLATGAPLLASTPAPARFAARVAAPARVMGPAAGKQAGGGLYPSTGVQFEGHGWGHGRGMGQYGALGYAIQQGWSYHQILAHFYGGTQPVSVGDPAMSIQLTALDGTSTAVEQEKSELTTSANQNAADYAALRAVLVGPNTFEVDQGPGCAGPWSPVVTATAGPVTFAPSVPTPATSTDHTNLLQVCEPGGGTVWYRGSIESVDSGGLGNATDQRGVNLLPMDDYLLGVVPSESPSSWGALGAGAGEQALDAQAVAARSYAVAQNRYPYAKTCDSTACQVYQGMAVQNGNGYRSVEAAPTTQAVLATSGQALGLAGGTVASAEYSSSTGGYTAGGTFPPAVDAGDAVPLNPYHTWDVTVSVSSIEATYPAIGGLDSIAVTQRNGYGDFGGRAEQVVIQGTAGSVTTTGAALQAALGLRSDWFSVVYPEGYWIAGADGEVFSFGSAGFFGSAGGIALSRPIVGMQATPACRGYWLVASDGGIFSYGDASFLGSTGGMRLNKPVVGMAARVEAAPAPRATVTATAGVATPITPAATAAPAATLAPAGSPPAATAGGYWLVASDGGIFSYGDAAFYGSTGSIPLNAPIVGMAATPDGKGYWLVASDGGIFSYGDAAFYGSTGSIHLNAPIVGMAATPDGKGYWLVASDGGIFSYGDAAFYGSTGSLRLNKPIAGLAATPDDGGYWLVASDGGIFSFGDATFFGSVPGVAPGSTTTKVAMAASGSS
jgi:SpoIID/LytB domain protein